MSLDVYLDLDQPQRVKREAVAYVRENGRTVAMTPEDYAAAYGHEAHIVEPDENVEESTRVWDGNITHNLNRMAKAAGIYEAMWRPEEIQIERAVQVLPLLRAGLAQLEAEPDKFKAFNPPNGWGDYDGLVEFVRDYIKACERWPDAKVSTWR